MDVAERAVNPSPGARRWTWFVAHRGATAPFPPSDGAAAPLVPERGAARLAGGGLRGTMIFGHGGNFLLQVLRCSRPALIAAGWFVTGNQVWRLV
jgi:hypothetical protein